MIPRPTLDTYCVSGLVLGTGWESRGWELKLDGGLLREVELGLRCRDFAVEMIGERVQVSGLGTRGTEVLLTEQEFRKTSQFGMPSNAGGNFHTGRSSPAEKEECRPGVSVFGIESSPCVTCKFLIISVPHLLFYKAGLPW